jgi:hypothetical protein
MNYHPISGRIGKNSRSGCQIEAATLRRLVGGVERKRHRLAAPASIAWR